eukprot:Nk52_evm10s299 gene=Nk52_evmTU10s299
MLLSKLKEVVNKPLFVWKAAVVMIPTCLYVGYFLNEHVEDAKTVQSFTDGKFQYEQHGNSDLEALERDLKATERRIVGYMEIREELKERLKKFEKPNMA